ncbi:hypothetical protein [Lysinibacillus sp. fls2-241-R2A-57]|uniref:hypothetical protein n=1 Tax=Lysinibacillus sp. fls2-241-R2A-57 TaxID=3040292 RepID=UPI00255670CB|nr:hypothetical protein [Lysinibacillus sp. fls2-241-R2A-57]
MDNKNQLNKVLRLLDVGDFNEAVEILKKIYICAVEENDTIYSVKSSCILGEYFLSDNKLEDGVMYLEKALSLKGIDDDFDDLLNYELDHAKELLEEARGDK